MIVLNLGLLHLCPVRAVLARVPLGPRPCGSFLAQKSRAGATAPKAASHDRWKSALTPFLATYFGSGLRDVPEMIDDLAISPKLIRKHKLDRSQHECEKCVVAAVAERSIAPPWGACPLWG
jgi:hypothetical protein